jgi:hypothetical protein
LGGGRGVRKGVKRSKCRGRFLVVVVVWLLLLSGKKEATSVCETHQQFSHADAFASPTPSLYTFSG